MSNVKEKGLVPALRFPEFTNDNSWKNNELGKLSVILRGGSPRPIDSFMTTDKDGLNWLKIGDVDKSAKYISMTKEKVIVEALDKTREVHPGDLIMSNSMSFGRPYIMKIKTCIHDGWIAVTEIIDHINLDYLYYFILSESAQFYFINAAAGGGIKNLNADIIKLLPVVFPEKKTEQQKIADCLSSLDELINAHIQKLDALKTHKEGLMQQLFPAEGETVPKLRFPEFRGEWHKNTLKDICKINQGLQIPISKRFTKKIEGSYFYITNEFLKAGAKNTYYIKNPTNSVICGKSDILMTRTGNTGQVVTGVEGAFHNNFFKIKYTENVVKEFLVFFLRSNRTQREILTLAGASTIPDLNHNDFYKIEISLPCRSEQQKIADCLLSVDEATISQHKKIDSLKAHKKGLMQQLFPNMDEVKV